MFVVDGEAPMVDKRAPVFDGGVPVFDRDVVSPRDLVVEGASDRHVEGGLGVQSLSPREASSQSGRSSGVGHGEVPS